VNSTQCVQFVLNVRRYYAPYAAVGRRQIVRRSSAEVRPNSTTLPNRIEPNYSAE